MAPAPQARAPMPHLTVVKTRLEFPHLGLTWWAMSGEGERGGCQVGDWHPVKYDAETHTDMDRQGDVAQDWEHGLMDWCR